MTDRPQEITVVRLADDTIEQLADRVADLLADRAPEPSSAPANPAGLLSAAQVSAWWGVDRGWVYQHADQLGAIRLGAGRRPRLRFDPDRVRHAMGQPDRSPTNPAPHPR